MVGISKLMGWAGPKMYGFVLWGGWTMVMEVVIGGLAVPFASEGRGAFVAYRELSLDVNEVVQVCPSK